MNEDKDKRPFRVLIPLLISQTIGALNDNGMKAMLPIMAAFQFGKDKMDQTNQIVSLLLIIPFVMFAPWAGWVSDRFSKKKVVSYTLLGQVLGLSVLCYALFIENLTIGLVGFFLLAVQSAFFSPGKKGILKELVGSDRLGMAVGWMEMLTMVGILGGAFAAASYFDLLVPIHGGWTAGLILSLIAIGMALFSWLLFTPTPQTITPKAEPFRWRVLLSHWSDLNSLWKDRGLRGAAIGDAWFWSVGSFFYLVLVKLSGEVVVGKVGMGGLYGYWFLLLGLGIMLGSLFVAYLNRGRVEVGLTPIGAILMPFSLMILYAVNPLDSIFDVGCLLLGFSGALFAVPLNGYLQDQAGESERGRILAASNLLTQLSSIGLILFHALLSNLGFSAKEELLIMAIPACFVTYLSFRFLLEDFFRALFHFLLRIFYRIRVVGMDGFSRKGGVLLVSNHLSYADPVFIGAAFPRKIRYLAYSGLAQSSIMRFVFLLTDTVTVSTSRSLDSMKTCVRRLKEGLPLCVFAEGGISRTGSVFPFKRGVLLLAKRANVPICPVHIDGVWGSVFSMQRGRFFFKKPLSFPYHVTVRVGAEIKSNSVSSMDVQLAVLNLGLDSFAERIPSPQKVSKLIERSFRIDRQEEFICFENMISFTRGEVAEFLTGGTVAKKYLSIPKENMHWINSMLATYQELSGPTKIWSSFLRVSETHLWDQQGFMVNMNEYLKPEWILWIAYLGLCKVEYKDGFLSVWHSKKKEAIDLQLVNGLSTDRNGLISLNFKSVAEQNGDFDEMEQGFKRNSLGRLLPGLSYIKEPRFGILGIDRMRDEVDFVKGLDEDGFLEVK